MVQLVGGSGVDLLAPSNHYGHFNSGQGEIRSQEETRASEAIGREDTFDWEETGSVL